MHPYYRQKNYLFNYLIFTMVLSACSMPIDRSRQSFKELPQKDTIFILVRHAERDDSQGGRALKPEGRERAKALVSALKKAGVTAIYSPDRGRNRETVQPLADHLGLTVKLVPERRLINTKKYADQFVNEVLSTQSGGVVVWVGNKSPVGIWGGNLQEIYKRLGGTNKAPSKYDDLFFVTITTTGEVKITKTTYGKKAGRFDQ